MWFQGSMSVAGSGVAEQRSNRPTMWLKAGALLQSVVGNHALVDGNQRLGWLSVAVFLEINDLSVEAASNDDVYALVMAAAQGELPLEDIAERLRHVVD